MFESHIDNRGAEEGLLEGVGPRRLYQTSIGPVRVSDGEFSGGVSRKRKVAIEAGQLDPPAGAQVDPRGPAWVRSGGSSPAATDAWGHG